MASLHGWRCSNLSLKVGPAEIETSMLKCRRSASRVPQDWVIFRRSTRSPFALASAAGQYKNEYADVQAHATEAN